MKAKLPTKSVKVNQKSMDALLYLQEQRDLLKQDLDNLKEGKKQAIRYIVTLNIDEAELKQKLEELDVKIADIYGLYKEICRLIDEATELVNNKN